MGTQTISMETGNGAAMHNGGPPKSKELLATGIAGLDNVLGGGFSPNHLYLIEGDPGTGKTTIALQFLLEGVPLGQKGLYVTLSESRVELLEIAASHGWSIDSIDVFEMSPDEKDLKPEAQYTVFNPSDLELADTTAAVLAEVERLQPTRLVLDSLSELRMLARDSLRYRRQILGLKRYFAGRNCTVLFLDDRTAERHDLQLQSIAHGVILMESVEREYGIKRRRLEVRKLRGAQFREGFHDYTIKRGGLEVYPRLIASEHHLDLPPTQLCSGIEELDNLLGGGLDSGTSTLLLGPAGCGKSTIAVRYAVSLAERGGCSALFAFDETLATLATRARGLGLDIKQHVESGKLLLRQVDAAELSPGQFIHEIRELIEKQEVKLVIIDSLNGFLNAMPGEKFLAMQLHELLGYLSQKGITTVMTLAQHGFVGMNVDTPVDISYLADTVLLFRYFEAAGEVKKALSVIKKRSGEHESTIRELVMKKGAIRVGDVLTEFEGVLTGVPKYRGKLAGLGRRKTHAGTITS
ncbi:MAG TPA: ATPase domain-containing protein [Candidatus Dormibacteraeota bacterium]|nr:ATPase domain-containing protein [Candidatus Dormibacteraeota bacterium]